jgi:hypothetical protein
MADWPINLRIGEVVIEVLRLVRGMRRIIPIFANNGRSRSTARRVADLAA